MEEKYVRVIVDMDGRDVVAFIQKGRMNVALDEYGSIRHLIQFADVVIDPQTDELVKSRFTKLQLVNWAMKHLGGII